MADKYEEELKRKIEALTRRRFGGDYKRMFDRYANNGEGNGTLDEDELVELLEDADIGNGLTRRTWARGIINKLDRDRDARLSYVELRYSIANGHPIT